MAFGSLRQILILIVVLPKAKFCLKSQKLAKFDNIAFYTNFKESKFSYGVLQIKFISAMYGLRHNFLWMTKKFSPPEGSLRRVR